MIKLILGKVLGGWYGYAIVALAAASATFWVSSNYHDSKELKQLRAWIGLKEAKQQENRIADKELSEKEEKTKIVYIDRVKQVIKYVKTHDDTQCLDADGLRLYREALKGDSTGKISN